MQETKESEERKLLKVLIYTWLKESYNELGRKIGPACKKIGLSLKDTEPMILDLINECFHVMKADIEKECQKGKSTGNPE